MRRAVRGHGRAQAALLAVACLLVVEVFAVVPMAANDVQNAAAPAPQGEGLEGGGTSRFDVLALARTLAPKREGNQDVWEYRLVISDGEIVLGNGKSYKVWHYNGLTPGPTLLAREGDRVRITLVNETANPHTLHSHGLFVPARMDGVPHALDHARAGLDVSAPDTKAMGMDHSGMHGMGAMHGMHGGGAMTMPNWTNPVEPGESYTYDYIARPAGTHWYHCHVDTNEHLDRGMSGALIVLPRTPEPKVDVDRVLILDEWNSKYGGGGTPGNPKETSDYDHFTINGKSFPETEGVFAEVGQVVRLRLVNAGAQLHFMHLHGHTFLVSHKDGRPTTTLEEMDTVKIGPGERYDLLIRANNPGTWCFHCHESPHVTNAGKYPGGMLMHLQVGSNAFPSEGEGPVAPGVEWLRKVWGQWRVRAEKAEERAERGVGR